MNRAVILLGSNTGNLSANMEQALGQIAHDCGRISLKSSLYKTEPWGNTEQPFFLNRVIEIETLLKADELLSALLHIEAAMGRKREVKWAPRIIDLDILFFNDGIIRQEGLTIPHPHLHERKFTLVPLNEILPDLMHPVLKKSVRELLSFVPDDSMVMKFENKDQPVR